jgi:predicted metal-dependent hydrolase
MIEFLKNHWKEIVAVIVGLYEVLVRAIPTISNISIVAFIIKVLKWISDGLNNVKK